MNRPFSALILGGTGQVGGAVVQALLEQADCREVVMITRKAIPPQARVRNVVLDTASDDFSEQVRELAATTLAQGGALSAVSCVGVGSGSLKWSEEELKRLELGVVGAFARGCHAAGIRQFCLLTAVGSTSRSRFRYVRVMGLKEELLMSIGFPRLAIFRPGIIAGNVLTPSWIGRLGFLLPCPWGSIEQRDMGRAFAEEIAQHGEDSGVVIRENKAMKALLFKKERVETSRTGE